MSVRVLIADDHTIVRDGLASLLRHEGFTVVAAAADGREAVQLARDLQPDVAILDLGMPQLNGLDAARVLAHTNPNTRIILLTIHHEEPYVAEAMRAGVHGYVLKTQATEHLVFAIREVARGALYFGPGITQAGAKALKAKADGSPQPLTARELEVLRLIAEGMSSREIAASLDISVRTAEAHRAHIMDRLAIHDTASLVRYAIRHGLIVP
jgi:DNA-binding NarL/FixJ family response regulator